LGVAILMKEEEAITITSGTSAYARDEGSRPVRQGALHEFFEEQVVVRPNAVALECGDSTVTYSALNQMADRVCAVLRRRHLAPETCVGVCLPRSPELVAALLGILKAGGAYLPLDLTLPAARLRFMLADASARFVIGINSQRPAVEELLPGADFIDMHALPLAGSVPAGAVPGERSLAYVLYTSGSTGVPKGVMVEHRSVVRLVRDTNYVTITPDDVFLQFAPLSFDASTFEIWAPLLNGARLAIAPPRDLSLSDLEGVIKRHRVSVLWLTAGLFHAFADERPEAFRHIKQLLAGGDVLSPAHVRKALAAMENGCVINGYGPTENTTFTCCYRVTQATPLENHVPIGQPIARSVVRILDSELRPAPTEEFGELFIGGDGLARGYLNRPELDREKFIPDLYSDHEGARLYRSGDLGRYTASGDIEFGGRIDSQIKLRGFRIEPGEIEVASTQCPGVSRATVVAVNSNSGDKSLFCFYVPDSDTQVTCEQLRSHLRASLPAYMVPAHYRSLPAIPLTANGKADRKKLAELGAQSLFGQAIVPEQLHEVEQALLEMFRSVLGIERLSLDDDFFASGGHSLAAARLFAKIEERFGAKLPLATMFKAPSIRRLAVLVRDQSGAGEWSPLVAIRTEGNRRPLFLVHAIGGNVLNYKRLDAHLPADQPIYAFQAAGLKDNRADATTIEEMAYGYITALRSVQPEGPYYLGGFSAGGVVAYEMAQQLVRQGEQVATLILFDSSVTPSVASSIRARAFRRAALRSLQIALWNLRYLMRTDPWSFTRRKAHNFRMNWRILMYQLRNSSRTAPDGNSPSMALTIEESFVKALEQYGPESYSGRVVLFRTIDSDYYNPDATLGWSELVPTGIDIVDVQGDHDTMFLEPQVETLGRKITAYLDLGAEESNWLIPAMHLSPEQASGQASRSEMRGSLSCG
jgi:amino acid adenylation domain-containing protein